MPSGRYKWRVGRVRVATLIIGLLVGLLLFLQSMKIGVFSDTSAVNDVTGTAGAVGLMMALLWLLASALVIPFPLVSFVIFLLTVPLGLFVPTGEFGDLRFHGGVAVVLSIMSFLGWRGKKKDAAEERAERQRQEERDARLESLLTQRAGAEGQFKCPSCGRSNAAASKYCGSCGTEIA